MRRFFRSAKQEKLWAKQIDVGGPDVRKLLDEFERVRRYQGPFKCCGTMTGPGGQLLHLTVILRQPGYGYFGIMCIARKDVEAEIREHDERAAAEIANNVGSHI